MLMNIFFPLCVLEVQQTEVFCKNRENSFFDELDDKLFVDLYAMKEHAHKTHLLAT